MVGDKIDKTNDDPFVDLLKTEEATYGTKYKEHLLEQYKLYVEMADHISERRSTANNFFLSVNGFLLSIIGILPRLNIITVEFNLVWLAGISAAGILFCLAWIALIRSYKKLNEAKFTVIGLVEKKLPATLFDAEWRYLMVNRAKKRRFGAVIRYFPLTLIEIWVPGICILIYLGLLYGWWYLTEISAQTSPSP
jgi:hypothetical protein